MVVLLWKFSSHSKFFHIKILFTFKFRSQQNFFPIRISAKENEIFANLTKAAQKNGHFKVYNQKTIPARWHAKSPTRLGPIFALADIGYGFQDLFEAAKYYKEKYNITSESKFEISDSNFGHKKTYFKIVFQ